MTHARPAPSSVTAPETEAEHTRWPSYKSRDRVNFGGRGLGGCVAGAFKFRIVGGDELADKVRSQTDAALAYARAPRRRSSTLGSVAASCRF